MARGCGCLFQVRGCGVQRTSFDIGEYGLDFDRISGALECFQGLLDRGWAFGSVDRRGAYSGEGLVQGGNLSFLPASTVAKCRSIAAVRSSIRWRILLSPLRTRVSRSSRMMPHASVVRLANAPTIGIWPAWVIPSRDSAL